MRATLPALAALSLLACDDDALNPVWRVDHVRVVAVLADPPDALPGERVNLRVVTALPARATGDVAVGWDFENTIGQGDSFAFTTTAGGPWTVGGYACNGEIRLGAAGPTCAGGEALAFIRTVRLRGAEPNHNPLLARITLDGIDLAAGAPGVVTACPSGECPSHAIDAGFAEAARDTVHDVTADGVRIDRPESLITAWLVDAGTLDGGFRSDNDLLAGATTHQNRWIAPPTAGTVRLWVVVRDGRGGFDAALRTIQVVASR